MTSVILELPNSTYVDLVSHLLPPNSSNEEAAFVFARHMREDDRTVFKFVDWEAICGNGYAYQSCEYLELADSARGHIIKRAHDLDASIVEFHSHPSFSQAAFSVSDRVGLREFVAHAWWRLKGRPYAAVVVSRVNFDGMAWLSSPDMPRLLDGICTETGIIEPTGHSLALWERDDAHRTF